VAAGDRQLVDDVVAVVDHLDRERLAFGAGRQQAVALAEPPRDGRHLRQREAAATLDEHRRPLERNRLPRDVVVHHAADGVVVEFDPALARPCEQGTDELAAEGQLPVVKLVVGHGCRARSLQRTRARGNPRAGRAQAAGVTSGGGTHPACGSASAASPKVAM
jgi:hypothetical protein